MLGKKELKAYRKARNRLNRKRQKFCALLTAAIAIPGLALSVASYAQSPVDAPEIRIAYGGYRDYQAGGTRRVKVNAPMAWFQTPITESTSLEGSGVLDSVSGASPYYHDALSGASGLGIEEHRKAGDLKLTHQWERWSVGVGTALSREDDYESTSGSIDAKWWSEDKNTTLAVGFAADSDRITATVDSNLLESRHTQHYFMGITQVLTPDSILQSNISYDSADGYQSDPYKPLDHRPRSREGYAWLTRYNRYLTDLDASLHTDYRLYADTFGVVSHMLEVSLYQPFAETWLVRPSFRYYTQRHARFYRNDYPPTEVDAIYSADQRLGSFGGISVGLRLEKDLGAGFSANAQIDYLEQRSGWALGRRSSSFSRFYAPEILIGMAKKF